MNLNSLENFIDQLRSSWGPLSSEKVQSYKILMDELLKTPSTEEWLSSILDVPGLEKELYRDAEHGFLVLAHSEHKGLYRYPHDHGSGWVIYGVYQGEIQMKDYKPIINQKGKMSLICRDIYTMRAGDNKCFLPLDVHDTECLSDYVLMLRLTNCDLKKETSEGRMVRYV